MRFCFYFLCLMHAYLECGRWLYFRARLERQKDDALIFDVISRDNYNIRSSSNSHVLLYVVPLIYLEAV